MENISVEELELCKNDFLYFVKNYVYIKDENNNIIKPSEFTNTQLILNNRIQSNKINNEEICINTSNNTYIGKTTTIYFYSLYLAITNNTSIVVYSNNENIVDLYKLLFEKTSLIKSIDNNVITMFNTNTITIINSLKYKKHVSYYLIDELETLSDNDKKIFYNKLYNNKNKMYIK